MLPVMIISIIGLFLTLLFIILELSESMKNFRRLTHNLKIYQMYQMPFLFIKAWWPFISDILLTLIICSLFSIGGTIVGTMLSFIVSATLSDWLYFDRIKKARYDLIINYIIFNI